MISNSPGSTTSRMSMFQKASDSRVIGSSTVFVSPGSSTTFRKPLSSFTGRVTELTRSRMYICTTSVPARLPVFVTVAVTRVDEQGTDAQEVHLKPYVDLRRVEFVQVLTKRVNGNR